MSRRVVFGRRRGRGPVQRRGDGLLIRLDTSARTVLVGLLDELAGMIAAGTAGRVDGSVDGNVDGSVDGSVDGGRGEGEARAAVLRRLFPPAYHAAGDAAAQAEYHRLMHDELVASRLATLQVVRDVLADATRTELDEGETMAFIGAVNQVRLVLGTLLDVSEDDEEPLPEGHPLHGEQQLYFFLSWLLTWAVEELSA